MAISIKTPDEIARMRVAGRLAADVLEMIGPHVQAGISTGELDSLCHDYIVNVQQAIPAPLNYNGFPKSICTSVNHVICHGIPSDTKILKKGDIINIDVTVIKDGFHGDTSKMFVIDEVPSQAVPLSRDCDRQTRNTSRRHRACHPDPGREQSFFSRARILRPRHWQSFS